MQINYVSGCGGQPRTGHSSLLCRPRTPASFPSPFLRAWSILVLFLLWLYWVIVAACGLSLVAVCGLLIAVASLVAEHGL